MMETHQKHKRQNQLQVAIIGCGFIAEYHVQAWRNVGAKIVAVCDKDVSLAKSKAEKWRITRYYGDIHEMIREENLDVASICTPANVRLDVVKPLLEKGIHVVIEKPFAMSVAEAEKMVELKKNHGVELTVVHNWLFSHMMKKVLLSLKRKEVGDILGVEMELLHTKDDLMAADSSHWCHSIEAGRFGELLPHVVYILRAILGEVNVKYILGSKLGSYSWMPIDELRILFENPGGKTASIYVSFNSPRAETTLKVIGTKRILVSNLSTDMYSKGKYGDISSSQIVSEDLHLFKEHLNSRVSFIFAVLSGRYKSTHTEFMKAFKNSLTNNTKPPVTAEEALEVVRLHKDLCAKISEQYFSK